MKTLSNLYNIVTTNNLKIIRIIVQLLAIFMDYLIYYKCTDEISVQNKYLFSLG